jgi:hypothetical protein
MFSSRTVFVSSKILPDAGTVKNRKPRTVPLYEHLIEQGLVPFVKASSKGSLLFYNEAKDGLIAATRPIPASRGT